MLEERDDGPYLCERSKYCEWLRAGRRSDCAQWTLSAAQRLRFGKRFSRDSRQERSVSGGWHGCGRLMSGERQHFNGSADAEARLAKAR
jgi:hypothetical protein